MRPGVSYVGWRPMLEKAAEALARSLGADWEMAPPSVRAKWVEGARAVLIAVRNVEDADVGPVTCNLWRAAVDHITKE